MIRFLQIFVLGMITVAGSVRAEEPKIKLSSPTVYVDSEVRDFPWTALSMATEQAGLYHFYSHGRAGELLIDGSWQDPIALAAFFEELLPMGITHLNIYGCEFAKGSKGLKALAYLEGYLGISIAASEDITGAGGDWDLEVGTSRGVISLPDYPYSLQCAGVVGGTLATDDYDGDGICNGEDLDDDNDGILDYYEACGSQSVPFTSLGQARAKVVKEGIYYFNLNGEVFSTFVDANGYVMVTIDYGDGSGSLPQVNALGTSKATDGRGILSSAIFAQFTNLTEVRISSNTAQTPNNQGIDAVSTNATLLNKIISFSTLNRGVPDNNFNKSWVGTNATYLNGTATCTSTGGTTLNANIFHPCGNTLGLHWIPSGSFQQASSKSGEILSSQYMRLWVRAAVNTDDCGDSDLDGIHNEFDLDSDGDGCPDALEGNGGITQADFISSSLAGGNTGPDFTGYATGVTVNLGNTVDANGVPTIVTGGQNVGTGLLQGVDSDGNGLGDACQDTDGDGFLDGDDADDDNDGILDNLENCMIISHGFTGLTPASRDRAKPNDNLKRDLIFEASAGTDEWEFNLSLSIPHGLIIESIIGDNDYARSGTVTVDGLSVNFAGTTGEFLTVRNVSATKADHIIHYSGEDVTVVGVRIYDMDMNPLIFYDFGTNTSPLASGYVGVSPSNFTGSFQVCYGYILDDLDKDGLINSMDLDSDGDGCPDAYEGEADVTFADLQSSNLAGGNSGPGYLGYSGPVIQNFPGPVDGTGVPSIVNGGQGSNFSLVPTVDRDGDGIGDACQDSDGDGVANDVDQDDDNDGILDLEEGSCTDITLDLSDIVVGSSMITEEQLVNFGTFDGLETGNSSNYIVGTTDGDLSMGYNSDSQVMIYTFTFSSPVNIIFSQANNGLADFDQNDGWGIQVNAGLLRVDDPDGELQQINGANSANLSFVPTRATGHTPIASSNWTITATNITSYSLSFQKSPLSNTNSNRGAIRQKVSCVAIDIDRDGLANYLDLDSDGDGCPDMLEGDGGFTAADYVESTMDAGNTGDNYLGYAAPIAVNFGTDVNGNGIPTIVGAGQEAGSSQFRGVDLDSNNLSDSCQDSDGDGVSDYEDKDDDNDGILDDLEMDLCKGNLTFSFYSDAPEGDTFFNFPTGPPYSTGEVSDFDVWKLQNEVSPSDPDTYSIRYSGFIKIPSSNTYIFTTRSDDGTGLYIDGVLVVNNDGVRPAQNASGNIYLEEGFHRIELLYFENGAGQELSLYYQSSSIAYTNVPFSILYPDSCTDTDQDGILNFLDLDSDGDGCSDAYEGGGGFTSSDFTSSSMAGGNTGDFYNGYAGPVSENLGITVNLDPQSNSYGVPISAGSGQAVGESLSISPDNNSNGIGDSCEDLDGDGIYNTEDRDDDNDGVPDLEE